MEYTIRELADLSGVTTRTLRWYDQIGLLKPGRVAENGYRYYGPAQVDRLQDILYYRALGVELAQIKACLDDPSFDRLAALRGHLAALEQEQARLEALIRSVRRTISAQERKELMNDQEKFEALKQRAVAWHEETYGREAREKYGDREVDAAQDTVRGLTQEQYREWTGLGDEIQRRLEAAPLYRRPRWLKNRKRAQRETQERQVVTTMLDTARSASPPIWQVILKVVTAAGAPKRQTITPSW